MSFVNYLKELIAENEIEYRKIRGVCSSFFNEYIVTDSESTTESYYGVCSLSARLKLFNDYYLQLLNTPEYFEALQINPMPTLMNMYEQITQKNFKTIEDYSIASQNYINYASDFSAVKIYREQLKETRHMRNIFECHYLLIKGYQTRLQKEKEAEELKRIEEEEEKRKNDKKKFQLQFVERTPQRDVSERKKVRQDTPYPMNSTSSFNNNKFLRPINRPKIDINLIKENNITEKKSNTLKSKSEQRRSERIASLRKNKDAAFARAFDNPTVVKGPLSNL